MRRRTRESTDYLVVHWAFSLPDPSYGADTVDRWHRENGFLRIGYHYVIPWNGLIEEGELEHRWGAHARPYNDRSIGICLIGGRDEDGEMVLNFSDSQLASLVWLLDRLKEEYPEAQVVGHRDLTPDSAPYCPGFDAGHLFRSGEVRPVEGVSDNLTHAGG